MTVVGQWLNCKIMKDLNSIRFLLFANAFCIPRQCIKFLTCNATNSVYMIFG